MKKKNFFFLFLRLFLINYKNKSFYVDNIVNLIKRDGKQLFLPCTPKGIIELLVRTGKNINT